MKAIHAVFNLVGSGLCDSLSSQRQILCSQYIITYIYRFFFHQTVTFSVETALSTDGDQSQCVTESECIANGLASCS